MKRVNSLLICIILCLAVFASCTSNEANAVQITSSSAVLVDNKALEEIETLNVAVFYYNFEDVYVSTVRDALDEELSSAGIEFKNYDAGSEQKTQNEQITAAINEGANFLIVNIVEPSLLSAAQDFVKIAKSNDIPIVFFNREIYLDIVNSYEKCSYVGTDTQEAGYLQGNLIGDYLIENYDAVDLNGDGKITYVMFKGQEGNAESQFRTQFAVENANAKLASEQLRELVFFEEDNEYLYYVDEGGNWSVSAAQEYMSEFLKTYSVQNGNMIELVIANNDGMAIGAINALNAEGYNTGEAGSVSIPVFGVDATQEAQDLIAQGKMTGTIKQNAQGMANAIATIVMNVKNGEDFRANTEDFNIDQNAFIIRIPYEIYTG